jgi:hypothetical protein
MATSAERHLDQETTNTLHWCPAFKEVKFISHMAREDHDATPEYPTGSPRDAHCR